MDIKNNKTPLRDDLLKNSESLGFIHVSHHCFKTPLRDDFHIDLSDSDSSIEAILKNAFFQLICHFGESQEKHYAVRLKLLKKILVLTDINRSIIHLFDAKDSVCFNDIKPLLRGDG